MFLCNPSLHAEVEHPEPPDFVVRPSNLAAHEGETTTFTCQVKGQPMPSVLWKKEGAVIANNQKFKITRIGDRHTLKIYSLDQADAGEYTCHLRNTEGETSHVCWLDVAEPKLSAKSQTTDTFKTRRPATTSNMEEMSQFSPQTTPHEKHQMTSPETTNGYTMQTVLHREDEIENTQAPATRTIHTSLFETNAEENNLHHLHQSSNRDGNSNSRPYHVRNMTENTELSHTFSKSVANVQPPPNKVYQEMEKIRSVSTSEFMDSRRSLHPHKSTVVQPGELTLLSNETDFKRVTLKNNTNEIIKTDLEAENVKAKVLTSEPKSNTAPSRAFTSVVHPSSSLSSRVSSLSHEKKDHGLVKDLVHKLNDTTNDTEPAALQQNVGTSTVGNVSSASVIPPTQTAAQSWRRQSKGNSPSSSTYQHFSADDGTTDFNKVQEGLKYTSMKTGNSLFQSEVQVVDTRTHERRSQTSSSSSTEDCNMFSDAPSTTSHRDPRSDNYHVSQRSSLAVKSAASKHESQKVNLLQLSACKVSISEFNPSEPQSDALKLEVTSITASVPSRQSLSSPRSNSESHSVRSSTQQDAHIKQKDDSMFTLVAKEAKSTEQEFEQTFKGNEAKSNLQTIYKGNKLSWDNKDDKNSIHLDNYAYDKINHTNDREKPTAQSRTRFSEKVNSSRNNNHQESKSAYRLSTVSRHEMGPGSNATILGSGAPSAQGNEVDDFRSIKLKPTASKGKDSSDLSKSKFMSKSTESIFTDVRLKPVLKTEDNWKRSELAANADRIRASSKSSDLSKLLPSSSYLSSIKNKPVAKTTFGATATAPRTAMSTSGTSPRATISTTSTTSKFTDSLKVFAGDDKSKIFNQSARYSKSTQSSKLRASSGKHEKVSSGGVTRSNSHRKSKGIGAKFEAAIKDIKSTQQVPYASLQLTKNRTAVKPPVHTNSTEYSSKRDSNQHHGKPAEDASAEKGWIQPVSKYSPANAVKDSNGDSYGDKVSEWAKKRQSLHVDVPSTLSLDKNAQTESKILPTIALEKSQCNRKNQETNELHNMNTAIPNDKQDIYSIKTNFSNKQSEVRIRNRSESRNLQDNSGASWVGLQGSQDNRNARQHQQDHAGISRFNTEHRISHSVQDATSKFKDATQVTSATAADSSSKPVDVNIVRPPLQPLPKQSALPSNEPVNYNQVDMPVTLNSTSSGDRTTGTYKSQIVMIPKSAVTTKPSSTIITLPRTKSAGEIAALASQPTETAEVTSTNLASTGESVANTLIPQVSITSISTTTEMKSSLFPRKTFQPADNKMQALQTERSSFGTSHASNLKGNSEMTPVEGFSEKQSPMGEDCKESFLGNSGSSWKKQRSRRPIPVYPVNDNELFQTEMDISSTTDLDSLMSTTSISSSSSDASNVTADSGFTRRPTGNDRIQAAVKENLHHDSWNRQDGTDKHNQALKYPIDNNQDMKTNLREATQDRDYVQKPNIYKRNMNNEDLLTEQKHVQSQRNKQRVLNETANVTAVSNPSDQAELENEHTEVYGYKALRRDIKEAGHTSSNISEVSALKYASATTESTHSIGLKEDFVSDPIPRSEYISRRQRRQLENHVVTTIHTTSKMETNEITNGRFSDSNPADIVTSKESFSHKQIPVSYETSSREKSQSKTENTSSTPHSNRTEPIDETNVSNSGRVRKRQVDTDIGNTLEDVHSNRHILNASKSVDVMLQGLNAGQGGYVSTSGISNDLNEHGQTSNSHLSISDQISTMELRQRWRNSRQQKTNASLDKGVATSIGSDSVAQTLSQSTTGAISVSTSAPLATKSSSYTLPTPGASLSGAHCPPSFPTPLQDVTVMYGSPAILRCQVIGNPRPDVKWLLNQKPVEVSDKIDIIYRDCIAQLSITETCREHQGDFTCWAKNSQGTVSCHCTLHLIDDLNQNLSCQTEQAVPGSVTANMSDNLSPSNDTEKTIIKITPGRATEAPAGKPCVSAKDSHSVSLSWSGCTSRHESDVLYYIIEGNEVREKAWEIFIAQCKLFPCTVEGLKPGTSYQFRVLAANKHGVSPPSEPSETVTTFDSPTLTNDFEYEGKLPFKPREVQINTTNNFEDLYEKDKEVGKGKFGVVYKCKQKSDGSVWAAKIVRCREKEKVNLRREIAIMNKLHHPKLLHLWDAFESPRQMVLVMEYIGAGELFERVIGDDYILTENDCIHFVRQICDGLAYMHSKSILHLDLKPENILCVAEHSNRIKIIDFGLAQFYTPGQGTKVLFGTPEFIAPEVINYDEISFETDMWSLGVICYVLLSGLSPFLGDSDAETLASVTTGDYDFDDEAFDEISDVAKDFISKLLVKKKEKRMLTEQCLAHPWLSQDEVDGILGKRLNTERLKKFMIRRKWLKTGNAVKAVSRLMKSNSLTGFGINLQHNNSLLEATPSNISAPESALQKTEVSDNEDDDYDDSHSEFNSTENDITSEISQNLHSIDSSFQSVEENGSSANIESNFNKTGIFCDSEEGNGVSSETVVNSVEEHSAEFVSQVIPRRLRETTSKADETKPWISSRSFQGASERVKSLNEDFVKTEAYSASLIPRESNNSPPTSSLTAVQRKSKESAQGNRISLQSSNRRTEVNQASRLAGDKNLLQAPDFTKPMIRCKTSAGDVARFDVRISGEPLPHVTWFFEDEEIISDTRHVLSLNENTRSFSLIIRNVEEDDEGEYTCKAVNSLGESSCSAELVVLVF